MKSVRREKGALLREDTVDIIQEAAEQHHIAHLQWHGAEGARGGRLCEGEVREGSKDVRQTMTKCLRLSTSMASSGYFETNVLRK